MLYSLVKHILLDSLVLLRFDSTEFNKKKVKQGVLSRSLSALFFCNEIALLILKSVYPCFYGNI